MKWFVEFNFIPFWLGSLFSVIWFVGLLSNILIADNNSESFSGLVLLNVPVIYLTLGEASPFSLMVGFALIVLVATLLIRRGSIVVIFQLLICGLLGILVLAAFLYTENTVAEKLVFSGNVVRTDVGSSANDRLVVIFLNGQEIGRAFTTRTELPALKQGILDGTFVAEIDNVYGLSLSTVDTRNDLTNLIGVAKGRRSVSISPLGIDIPITAKQTYPYIYYWLGEIPEGSTKSIYLPSKKATFVIKVIPGSISPPLLEELNGPLELSADGTIIASASNVFLGSAPGVAIVENIRHLNSEALQMEINRITVPLDNCGGSVILSQKYSYSQLFTHEYREDSTVKIGVDIPVGVWLDLTAQLEKTFGFKQGEVSSQAVEYNMAVEPGTSLIYEVVWKEIWESGTADMKTGNDTIVIPFRAKTGLVYEVISRARDCQ